MILYLDTSALVKVYVTEPFREPVVSAMQEAEAVASHRLAYVEAHAAFARALSDGKLTEGQLEAVKREFRADWENYLQVGASQSLIQRAADLAEAFHLRACDSVHLAAADFLHAQSGETVLFACFDRKLNRAAAVLGLSSLKLEL